MKAAKADNKKLETEVARLTTSNDKLANDEGLWYSMAKELENKLEVIKKVRVMFVCPQPTEAITGTTMFCLVGQASRLVFQPFARFRPFPT